MNELHFNLRVGGWYFTFFFNSNRTLYKQTVQGLLRFGCTIGVASITQYTHVRNKIVTLKGGMTSNDKSAFPYLKELLLKERIRSLWGEFIPLRDVPI